MGSPCAPMSCMRIQDWNNGGYPYPFHDRPECHSWKHRIGAPESAVHRCDDSRPDGWRAWRITPNDRCDHAHLNPRHRPDLYDTFECDRGLTSDRLEARNLRSEIRDLRRELQSLLHLIEDALHRLSDIRNRGPRAHAHAHREPVLYSIEPVGRPSSLGPQPVRHAHELRIIHQQRITTAAGRLIDFNA